MDLRTAALVVVPAGAAVAALVAACAAVLRARRRSRAGAQLPAAVEALLRGTATALGDAVAAFDGEGRLVWANGAAVALSGVTPEMLRGRPCAALGPELEVLLRGLSRGPAAARVTIRGARGEAVASAVAVRIPGRPTLDVVVLRPEADPPLPVDDADIVADPAPPAAGAERRSTSAPTSWPGTESLRVEVQAPIARATGAAAMLRMVLPAGASAAGEHLARIDGELRAAERALAAWTEPLAPAACRAVDLDALLSELLGAARVPAVVRVERSGAAGHVLADPAQLRRALSEVLRRALDAMPEGGVLALRAASDGGEGVLEVVDSGPSLEPAGRAGLALARRLVALQGGRLERAAVPGRGSRCRLALRAAETTSRARA